MRQLVDASGSVGLAQTFDPYGNGYATSGSASSRLGWTGEQTDSNGFVFLRARYYQPGMGRFTQMDPSRQERNAYQYSLSDPINLSDPTGTLPCDGLAGAQLSSCLDAIKNKISLFSIQSWLPLGVSPAFPDYQFAGRLVKHYLEATGTTRDFSLDDFSSGFKDYNGKEALAELNSQPTLLERDLQANFGSQLCAGQLPLAVAGHSNFFVGNYQFSRQITPAGGYHYGMGTIVLNGPYPSAVHLSPYLFYPKRGVVTVKTTIELYDHYDWCYGSALCEARDAQGLPGLEFFVGEAMALEKAGRAAQFDWYAQWIVKTKFDVDSTSGTIKITGSHYAGYEKLAGPPLHYTTSMAPTYWDSSTFDDDWLCTQQSHDISGCG